MKTFIVVVLVAIVMSAGISVVSTKVAQRAVQQ